MRFCFWLGYAVGRGNKLIQRTARFGKAVAPGLNVRVVEVCLASVLTALLIYWHVCFFLQAGALWRDEANSVHWAELPSLSHVWAALGDSNYPILFPLLLRCWKTAGLPTGDLALRAIGLLVGLATVAALWFCARRLRSSVPILSLTAFAISPLLIRVGDSLRPYGLGILFVLLALGFVWSASVAPTWRNIGLATLASILSVQCHYMYALLILAMCLSGMIVASRSGSSWRVVAILGIGMVAALSLLPYWHKLQEVNNWAVMLRKPLDFPAVWEAFEAALRSSETLAPAAATSWIAPGTLESLSWLSWRALWLVGIPMTVVSFLVRPRLSVQEEDVLLFCLTFLITAALASWVFVKWAGMPPASRYFFGLMAVAAVGFDALSDVLAWRMARIVALVILVTHAATFVPLKLETPQTNIDQTAEKLERLAGKNDLVIVNPWYLGVSFQRYYHGPACWTTLPPLGETLTIHRFTLLKKTIASTAPLEPLEAAVRSTLQSGNSIWVVGNLQHSAPSSPEVDLPPAPNGPVGWYAEAYLDQFRARFDSYLTSHAEVKKIIIVPLQEDKAEHAGLLRFHGWNRIPKEKGGQTS
jgi:hypothetical protein